MKKHLFLLSLCLNNCFFLIAQDEKRANIWYFNTEAGINFNTSPPTPLTDGKLNTFPGEGSASLCDQQGDLLIYTNGETIWNRNHEIIADSIGGNTSVTQSSIILPNPADEKLLYIFYLNELRADELDKNGEFYYATVDMRLNGGLGGVVSLKNKLYDFCTEQLTAVRHCNKKDFWIINHENGTDNFLIWKLTADGVSSMPKIQRSGRSHSTPQGTLKSSPLGDRIAISSLRSNFVELFEFDTEEGKLRFPISLTSQFLKNAYSLAFSPNGKRLYVSNFNDSLLLQFNLELTNWQDINASETIIAKMQAGLAKPGTLQNAPDGKLYLTVTGSPYLSAIRRPNLLGEECDFNEEEIFLNGKKGGTNLPNFLPIYFRQKDTIEVIELSENCEGKKELNATVSVGGDSIAYEWYFENQLLPNSNDTRIQVELDGDYELKVLIFDQCKTVLRELTSQIDAQFPDIPSLQVENIIKQDATCAQANGNIQIEASGGVIPYQFSRDGIVFQDSNVYSNLEARTVEVVVRDERNCEVKQAIEIQQFDLPKILSWQSESTACGERNGRLMIKVTEGFGEKTVAWENDLFSENFTRANLGQGAYFIQIKDEADCTIDTVLSVNSLNCPVYVPNAFSPNDDGQNDVFQLFPHPEFEGIIRDFKIFDRWGNLVFERQESTVEEIEWDGRFKDRMVSKGNYPYLLSIEYVDGERVNLNGEVYVSY
ncbi:MAG: gliding motility-associated C-terminal domain-containing protein [Bacteroidota bacterium]